MNVFHHKSQEKNESDSSLPNQPSIHFSNSIEHISTTSLLPERLLFHLPEAGINPIVDSAAYIFSILGKLKTLINCHVISSLQTELIHEINIFQNTIQRLGFAREFIIVARFVLCATIDELFSETNWGKQGKWDNCLLKAFNQDTEHHDKLFALIERLIKEPKQYIDLMELIYICLSLGYQGQYRHQPNGIILLEQITHHLYQHIQAYRGSVNKSLSPKRRRLSRQRKAAVRTTSLTFIFIMTACTIMTIFLSLGYLMDVASNEVSKSITALGKSTSS